MDQESKPKKPRRPRRSFTDEFKASAVRLVLDQGKSVAAAARDLDLTASALQAWVNQARADRSKGKTGLTTAEREELTKLRKQVRELTMERDILIRNEPSTTIVVRVPPSGCSRSRASQAAVEAAVATVDHSDIRGSGAAWS